MSNVGHQPSNERFSNGSIYTESLTNARISKKLRKKQIANRARHRLLSIYRDAQTLQSTFDFLVQNVASDAATWPIIPNERCGTWYCHSPTTAYFKSTDGHYDTWNFSFKRLNLQLLDIDGGCVLVDSSVRKLLPDSFARTIPIWACVMNRIVARYRSDFGLPQPVGWDCSLYTPILIVCAEEHSRICSLLEDHVEALYQSKAIVNPQYLIQKLVKPIRPLWITNGGTQLLEPCATNDKDYFWIVCVNPSTYEIKNGKNQISWIATATTTTTDEEGFYYMSGAADDQESWARNLTPKLFWQHHIELTDSRLSEDQIDQEIDDIVSRTKFTSKMDVEEEGTLDRIGSLSLWISSRRAGRPPHCWENFDAVLNVTDQEYDGMAEQRGSFYLQLPVAEGKRDRTELERWMPVGLVFLVLHLQQRRRVLVHCNQGKDRSVAVVLAFVALACPLTFPIVLAPDFHSWRVDDVVADSEMDRKEFYLSSGLPLATVDALLQDDGKETFLRWAHSQKQALLSEPLANKDRLRIVLHLIRQDRSLAEPTRSTMQKINRFLMSSPIYRSQDL